MRQDEGEFTLVYRGFDPVEAGLLARMLLSEGIVCRQLGTRHPALLGIGEFVCEQRLEVWRSDASRARELLGAAGAIAEPTRPAAELGPAVPSADDVSRD